MNGGAKRYEIELWSQGGSRVADISALAFNRKFTMQRNEAETLTFDLDVFAFEEYCANNLGGADPKVLIQQYVTDVKVKRNGSYLFGAQVVDVSYDSPPDSSIGTSSSSLRAITATITCSGYLNFFNTRYIQKTYTNVESTAIATDMLTTTQSQTNGSVGVTNAGSQYYTGVLRSQTYQLNNVKQELQKLAAYTDAPFDFSFSYSKVFQTYKQIGARRTDVSLIYGGSIGNVIGFKLDRSAINLFNKVYGIGSGFGQDAITSTQTDSTSQLNYYVRETQYRDSTVTIQTTLNTDVAAVLARSKTPLALPVVTITSNEVPANNFISVGDRIPLQVKSHTWLSDINGLYRVEKIDVTIDENDFESAITLTFDNFGVNQSE